MYSFKSCRFHMVLKIKYNDVKVQITKQKPYTLNMF